MFNVQKEYIPIDFKSMWAPKYSCLVVSDNIWVAIASDIRKYGIMEFDDIFEISWNYLNSEHITISFDDASDYSWCEAELSYAKITYRRVEVNPEFDYNFISLF